MRIASKDILIKIVAILIISYVFIRGYNISFTHDESHTVLHYLRGNNWFINVLSYKDRFPNNHYLNSLLTGISILIFRSRNEIVLRLPNILSSTVFLFSTYQISLLLKSKLQTAFFIFLSTNLFVLEQFSLTRGYGIGLSFVMLAIYYNLKSSNLSQEEGRGVFFSVLYSALAVLSNLTFLIFFVANHISLLLVTIIKRALDKDYIKKVVKTIVLPVALIDILLFFFTVGPILDQQKSGLFYYGGKSLVFDTFRSLIMSSYYLQLGTVNNIGINSSTILSDTVVIVMVLLSIFLLLIGLEKLLIKKEISTRSLYFISSLISISVSLSFVFFQNLVMKTPFPLGRTAIIFIPLFFVFSFCAINFLPSNKNILFLISIILCIHVLFSIKKANLKYTWTWQYDANTKDVYYEIRKYDNKRVCLYWLYKPTFNYYDLINNTKIKYVGLKNVTNENIEKCDFLYLPKGTILPTLSEYIILKDYKISNSRLYARK